MRTRTGGPKAASGQGEDCALSRHQNGPKWAGPRLLSPAVVRTTLSRSRHRRLTNPGKVTFVKRIVTLTRGI